MISTPVLLVVFSGVAGSMVDSDDTTEERPLLFSSSSCTRLHIGTPLGVCTLGRPRTMRYKKIAVSAIKKTPGAIIASISPSGNACDDR